MKTKNHYVGLKERCFELWDELVNTVVESTKENPLIFISDDEDLDNGEFMDRVWELPYGYYIDKYSGYNQGAIKSIQGRNVVLFMTGEGMWGDEFEIDIAEIPFHEFYSILDYIE